MIKFRWPNGIKSCNIVIWWGWGGGGVEGGKFEKKTTVETIGITPLVITGTNSGYRGHDGRFPPHSRSINCNLKICPMYHWDYC